MTKQIYLNYPKNFTLYSSLDRTLATLHFRQEQERLGYNQLSDQLMNLN